MSPGAVIDSIPLDTLWRCSETILRGPAAPDGKPFPIWIFLCAALVSGFVVATRAMPLRKGMTLGILIFDSIIFGGTLTFIFPVPDISTVFQSLFFLLIFSAKISLLHILTNVSRTPCFKAMIPANIALATFIPCLTASFALAGFLMPSFLQSGYFLTSLSTLLVAAVIIYVFTVIRILFHSKSSLFYSFLYLCTLEFIPMAVVTVMLTRL